MLGPKLMSVGFSGVLNTNQGDQNGFYDNVYTLVSGWTINSVAELTVQILPARPHRAYAIAFMPEKATFNGIKDVMPTEYFKSLRVGDLLDNDEIYPLIWSNANPDRE